MSIIVDNESLAKLDLQLVEGQKPSKIVAPLRGNGLDKCNKISSQYSMYDFIFISYVKLCVISTFQKSTYLDSPTFMNFSLSTNLDASLPQIGRYGIGLGTPMGNFDDPSRLAFHNLINIYQIPNKIYGGNFVLHHRPPYRMNKKSK
jgi:hypothetical protein